MLRLLVLLLLVAVLGLGASVGYVNAQTIHFNYLFGELELPLIAIMIAAFAVGVVLALIAASGRIIGQRLELGRVRRQLRAQETELHSLRELAANPVPPATPVSNVEYTPRA
ncbi:lipopolysaccharide assembly LapA domain-containing protein [Sinimarinibacterium sp. NLF-5-8]|uniref:LapA family protein n=1 Tax=Sinimarinibacterium sp. NLF-5-8 TaxID=2698684 RepID=UPI00137BB10C|nr:LapA family protein [Sinimarinibacterium sp. NLF-5-8]QHS09622.1 LapA family protein [Sinimarinibacterium sp. NLF-5-8]